MLCPEPAEVVDPPKPDNAMPHIEGNQGIDTIEERENDQVIDERPANHPRDIVVEAESHLHENHTAEESVASASQEDAPKKSYASIVSSQTKKGPTKVYVPSRTAKIASAKMEKKSINTAAESSGAESSQHHKPVNAPESDGAQDEGIIKCENK